MRLRVGRLLLVAALLHVGEPVQGHWTPVVQRPVRAVVAEGRLADADWDHAVAAGLVYSITSLVIVQHVQRVSGVNGVYWIVLIHTAWGRDGGSTTTRRRRAWVGSLTSPIIFLDLSREVEPEKFFINSRVLFDKLLSGSFLGSLNLVLMSLLNAVE